MQHTGSSPTISVARRRSSGPISPVGSRFPYTAALIKRMRRHGLCAALKSMRHRGSRSAGRRRRYQRRSAGLRSSTELMRSHALLKRRSCAHQFRTSSSVGRASISAARSRTRSPGCASCAVIPTGSRMSASSTCHRAGLARRRWTCCAPPLHRTLMRQMGSHSDS